MTAKVVKKFELYKRTFVQLTFMDCTSLSHVKLPKFLETINVASFAGCISLKTIDIPISVKNIKSFAFYNCHNLTKPKLSDNVKNAFNAFKVSKRIIMAIIENKHFH